MGVACFEKKDRVDLKPEYIQEMMEDNAKKEDEIKSLKKDLKVVKKKNKEYKSKNSELLLEIEKLKSTCNQYQLMLQFQNNNQNNVNNNKIILIILHRIILLTVALIIIAILVIKII